MSFIAILGSDAQSLITTNAETGAKELEIISLRSSMLATATIYDNNGTQITSLQNFTLTVLGDETSPYVMFYAVATVQGVTSTSYIILYLCDDIPAQKVLEVVVGDKTFTEVLDEELGMPMGDFEMQVLNDSDTEQEWLFIAYLGHYEELPEEVELTSIYCMYTGTMTDLISGESFTALEEVTLQVGTIGNDAVPCVAYSIVFSPVPNVTITVKVVLYLIDESEKQYPAVVTIGENTYDFKLNAMNYDFGDLNIDMNNGYFYITETTANQNVTSITITLDQVYEDDYSYMVLIGDAYDGYMENVELNEDGVYNSNYIDGLLAVTDNTKQAFRVTDPENLTMTIPITFVDGLAFFDIASEGFLGYLPEDYVHDMTFVRVYIVIEGVGQLPEGDNGNQGVNPGVTPLEFTVTLDDEVVNSSHIVMVDGDGDIYVRTTKTQAELTTKGLVSDFSVTFDAFTCPDNYYFFTITGTDDNTHENIYQQLTNGGYLSSNIVNTNEFGNVARILVYDTLDVDGDVTPVYRINVIFADSAPVTQQPMEEPEVNVTVVSNGLTFSTTNGTLIWDSTNHYFYAILPESVGAPTSNYLTIDSCVITDLEGNDTSLILKGDVENNQGGGVNQVLTFESAVSLYMYAFADIIENGCAGYIGVYNSEGVRLYQIAIAYDYSNFVPAEGEILLAVAYGEIELYLSQDDTGNILEYDGGDSGYFYAYLGSDANILDATELTLDALYVYDSASVVDAFDETNVITLEDDEAESVTLKIDQHNSMNCVAIQISEEVILYLYLADEPQQA